MQSQKLHRLELEVMKVVWRLGKATVNDVRNALKQPLAYTSVATTLSHLEKKGFLTHDVDVRTYIYRPLIQENEVSKSMCSSHKAGVGAWTLATPTKKPCESHPR